MRPWNAARPQAIIIIIITVTCNWKQSLNFHVKEPTELFGIKG